MSFETQLPPKIGAALEFLKHAQCIRAGAETEFSDPDSKQVRELSPQEKRVEDTALQTLAEYFNMDEGLKVGLTASTGEDEPPDEKEKIKA